LCTLLLLAAVLAQECPDGTTFNSCGSACHPTCNEPEPEACIELCVERCDCPEGTVQVDSSANDDPLCVTLDQCPGPDCGANEQLCTEPNPCEGTEVVCSDGSVLEVCSVECVASGSSSTECAWGPVAIAGVPADCITECTEDQCTDPSPCEGMETVTCVDGNVLQVCYVNCEPDSTNASGCDWGLVAVADPHPSCFGITEGQSSDPLSTLPSISSAGSSTNSAVSSAASAMAIGIVAVLVVLLQ